MSDNNGSIKINGTRLILCEGKQDASFLKHLIEKRNLPQFDIFHPSKPHTETVGRNGFKEMLEALSAAFGFSSLKGMIIFSDNDDNPQGSFRETSRIISSAEGYNAPNTPLEVVKTLGMPPLVVVTLPWINQPGALETLCLTSSYEEHPTIGDCLDKFVLCTGVDSWGLTKQLKMKMRCMLASACRSKPDTSLVWAWSQRENLIPLDHQCFDQIADFLMNFDSYIA